MIDWTLVGAGAMSVVTGGLSWLAGRGRKKAAEAADIATSRTDIAVADAESALYNRLKERLDMLENDVTRLRSELDRVRAHSRKQDTYIWVLIRMLRELGKEPPPFDDDAPQ